MKLTKKLNLLNSQKYFLIKCRQFDIYPKHLYNIKLNLHFYNHRCEQKFLSSKNTFLQQTLNVEINDTILQLIHLKNLYEETLFFIFRNFRIQDIKWFLYVHNKISLKEQQKFF